MRFIVILCIAWMTIPCVFAETLIKGTAHGPLAIGKSHVYEGTVKLSAEGRWEIRAGKQQKSLREIYLVPTGSWTTRQLGMRMYAALEKNAIANGRWHLRRGYSACRDFAIKGSEFGPDSLDELTKMPNWKGTVEAWNSAQFYNPDLTQFRDTQLDGPFIHLIPRVKFDFVKVRQEKPDQSETNPDVAPVVNWQIPHENRRVLAFELRPFIDDGKHWVLYTNGSCERITIDRQLIRKSGQKIRPVVSANERKLANERSKIPYKVILLTDREVSRSFTFEAYNHVLGETHELDWKLLNTDSSILPDPRMTLMNARFGNWAPYRSAGNGGVLQIWDESPLSNRTTAAGAGAGAEGTSVFSILGGRAAVEETLQLQALNVTETNQPKVVDIDSIQGVTVKSHPFKEMLAGHAGGQLQLAKYAPQDRFFLYIGKPTAVASMLDAGAPFIASVGSALTGNALNYGIEKRYLKRLGMNRDQLNLILKSGLVQEMALFCPDLFFIDGTEITVVAKVDQPELLQRLVSLLNPAAKETGSIVKLPGAEGQPAYMAMRKGLLFLGTNRSELEKSLALAKANGKGSLADSDEFRYMLTKLGVNENTRGYAYFSDPFVRRLVGPRMKIAQRRRMLAKSQMEALTACSMLARIDAPGSNLNVEQLKVNGYLPTTWTATDFSIDDTGLVHSETYGTLTDMRSLSEIPIQDITSDEASAYKTYLDNYSRYWRRFFDPIAVRLNEPTPDQLELQTFILPLVDNSIYNGLRLAMETERKNQSLSVPLIEPTPVVKFSMNLSEQGWQTITENFSDLFTLYSGAGSALLDDLGPSVHLAIFDSDPVIALGSGDVFGSFGSSFSGGNADAMLILPVALSMLTRPCSVFVETQNPERTAQFLRQAATIRTDERNRNNDFNIQVYQEGNSDKWVWMMNVMGVIKLRYGIEIIDNYVVIRNIPWSSDERIIEVVPAELNAAALQISPAACVEQLPGLFAAASDSNSRIAMSGLGRLFPFMLGNEKTIESAKSEHERLFGFYPKQVTGDLLTWKDNHLHSRDYGEPIRQRQPVFDPEKPFGLMNQIDFLRLNMQFEDDGLRSSIRWRTRQAK